MSSDEIIPFIAKGYGLPDEDLDEVILRENIRDVTGGYSADINRIQDRLRTQLRMRILEFSEVSGASMKSRLIFTQYIFSKRHLFYHHLFSNRDCCVVFVYSGSERDKDLFSSRLLPHEFAHHYQLVVRNFPVLMPSGIPTELLPQFALSYEIGPQEGEILVDGLLLPEGRVYFFRDFCERISDFVCEGILISNGFTKGLLDEYLKLELDSPSKSVSRNDPNYSATIRYFNRLALRDEAEWHALIKSAYGPEFVNSKLRLNKTRVLKLNKDLVNRKRAFKEVLDISLRTDYNDFKEKEKAVEYVKKVSSLLNIEVKTKEKW